MSLDELRRKILDQQSLPYTHQILNVQQFLRDNQQFFDKLTNILQQSTLSSSKRPAKSKSVSKFSISKQPTINPTTLKQRNQFLQKQLIKLRQQQTQRQFSQNPRLQDLQIQIQKKQKQVQIKMQINKQFREVAQDRSDMFEMYEKMCRRCESIRKINNSISQQLINSIKKINQLTGKDENPNLFIMNFK